MVLSYVFQETIQTFLPWLNEWQAALVDEHWSPETQRLLAEHGISADNMPSRECFGAFLKQEVHRLLAERGYEGLLLIITLAVGIFVLYYPTFVWLVQSWMTNPFYSHGFLVPIISGFFFMESLYRPCG